MPEITITLDTADVEALRTLLKTRLKSNWPTKPTNLDTIGTDIPALTELRDSLIASAAAVTDLIELAAR